MHFPLVTFAERTFRLLLIPPHWREPVEVSHRQDTLIGEGQTSIEERRPERACWLLGLKAQLTASGNAADDWRKGLAELGTNPLGVPLWVDALPVAHWPARIYEPEIVLNFDPDDSFAFALYTRATLPESPPHPWLAPLMLCRWSKRPPAQPQGGTVAHLDLDVVEARPWSWRIGARDAGGATWLDSPNWVSPPADASTYALETTELAPAISEPALDGVDAAARWSQEGQFSFGSRAAIREALGFYAARRGAWDTWTPVPAWFQPGTVTPSTPASYTARFASETLSLSYLSGDCARAKVGFIQEVSTPGRSQARPATAQLLQLIYQHDPANPELCTDWDAPLTVAGVTYTPAQFSVTEVIQSLKPQDAKVEIARAFSEGSLAHDWMRGRLFGAVRLVLLECQPDHLATPAVWRAEGLVTLVTPEGGTCKIEARPFGKLLDRESPGWTYGPRCNVGVFCARCGLNPADFRSTATISPACLSADGRTVTLADAAGWGGAIYAAQWFAPNGRLRTGAGRLRIELDILASEMSGGALVLTLSRALWPDMLAAGGQAAELLPGCGGQFLTDCIGKYDNRANFRAFPTAPDYLDAWETAQPGAAKK